MFIKGASYNGLKKELFVKKIWLKIIYPLLNVKSVRKTIVLKLKLEENKFQVNCYLKISKDSPLSIPYSLYYVSEST